MRLKTNERMKAAARHTVDRKSSENIELGK